MGDNAKKIGIYIGFLDLEKDTVIHTNDIASKVKGCCLCALFLEIFEADVVQAILSGDFWG